MSLATARLLTLLPLPLSPLPSPLWKAWSRQKNREIFSPAGRSCKKCASGGGYAPPEVCVGGWGASVRRVCTWRPTESPRALSCAPSRRSCLGVRMQFSPPSGGCVCCWRRTSCPLQVGSPARNSDWTNATSRILSSVMFSGLCSATSGSGAIVASCVRRGIIREKIARPVCYVLWITRRGLWNGLFLTVTTHRSR